MRATQTFVVDLPRLRRQGTDSELVIRLMRAADDIALANWGLRHYSQDQPRLHKHVQAGARRYFVRMQCGHLVEALKLVEQMNRSRRVGFQKDGTLVVQNLSPLSCSLAWARV